MLKNTLSDSGRSSGSVGGAPTPSGRLNVSSALAYRPFGGNSSRAKEVTSASSTPTGSNSSRSSRSSSSSRKKSSKKGAGSKQEQEAKEKEKEKERAMLACLDPSRGITGTLQVEKLGWLRQLRIKNLKPEKHGTRYTYTVEVMLIM